MRVGFPQILAAGLLHTPQWALVWASASGYLQDQEEWGAAWSAVRRSFEHGARRPSAQASLLKAQISGNGWQPRFLTQAEAELAERLRPRL